MSSSRLVVPPSILMHASLAYLSPEFQTFTFIIRHHSNNTLLIHPESVNALHASSSTTLNSLPPEVLLTIQYHLPGLIYHLSTLSDRALASYESSISSLLCTNCQEYNNEVYGPIFWDWPHFSGPCHCESVGKNCGTPSAEPITQRINTDLHPKQFRNPHHWLEVHLSKRVMTTRPWLCARMRKGEIAVWDLMAYVLHDFGCGVCDEDGATLLRSTDFDGRNVYIFPLRCGNEGLENIKEQRTLSPEITAIIGRVYSDLGLRFKYDDVDVGREEDGRSFRACVAGKSPELQSMSSF
ncbi:hypothetical protein PILCRDRAFT_246408 [Piloderma croceum F 1598]|uniref:Uncharacterized protein n=1 Tax=Piloderma croceum (strain F 1598) TaxID=765440 RepID=A0A0C3GB70_PILCF|nr:hypothetical protein PILCRDRAFT_246408 [Piloderma croceum F 1598]